MNKTFRIAAALVLLASSAAAAPRVELLSSTLSEDSHRTVTATYRLTGAPAIVTIDFQTNSLNWTSIGGQHLSAATGAVYKKIDSDGDYEIRWNAAECWPGQKIRGANSRIVLRAWSPTDAPDYMVVDLANGTAASDRVRYYPSEDYLPGGLLSNEAYWTTKLVMRRIRARGIPWTMGYEGEINTTGAANAGRHVVALTNDYYIGVFPITQGQWKTVGAGNSFNEPSYFTNSAYAARRPVERVSFTDIRTYIPQQLASFQHNASAAAREQYQWPNPPHPDSFLGYLRTRTGSAIDFDLPGEAQWEFACRAGTTVGFWNNGSRVTGENIDGNLPGRYIGNTALQQQLPNRNCDDSEGTKPVGSYGKNAWGLYDMHGNVLEWCLDNWQADITKLNGVINSDRGAPIAADGASGGNCECVVRGGSWQTAAPNAISGFRTRQWPNVRYPNPAQATTYTTSYGLRVVCTGTLK